MKAACSIKGMFNKASFLSSHFLPKTFIFLSCHVQKVLYSCKHIYICIYICIYIYIYIYIYWQEQQLTKQKNSSGSLSLSLT
jgi:hypothetical protein